MQYRTHRPLHISMCGGLTRAIRIELDAVADPGFRTGEERGEGKMKIPIAATRLVMSRLFRLPWLGAVFAVVLVAGALGGVAIAQIDSGDAYTGCLTDGGSINKVAIGNEPLNPCPQDQPRSVGIRPDHKDQRG